MSEGQDPLRIADIADQLAFLEDALKGVGKDAFLKDPVLQRAVTFALQVIGEASNYLSPSARAQASAVPWPKIIGLRHRIAHGYFSLDLDEIWRIAEADAPELKRQLIASGLWKQP
jgi:uncharacterized protein with HEPN domain